MFISELFPSEWIVPNLKSRTKEGLFKELCSYVSARKPEVSKETLLENLWERERQMTTGIALGVALPHTYVSGIGRTLGLLGLSKRGIEYNSLDGKPVHAVFFLLSDLDEPDEHVHVLKRIAMLLINPDFFPTLMKAHTSNDISGTLRLFEHS